MLFSYDGAVPLLPATHSLSQTIEKHAEISNGDIKKEFGKQLVSSGMRNKLQINSQ